MQFMVPGGDSHLKSAQRWGQVHGKFRRLMIWPQSGHRPQPGTGNSFSYKDLNVIPSGSAPEGLTQRYPKCAQNLIPLMQTSLDATRFRWGQLKEFLCCTHLPSFFLQHLPFCFIRLILSSTIGMPISPLVNSDAILIDWNRIDP